MLFTLIWILVGVLVFALILFIGIRAVLTTKDKKINPIWFLWLLLPIPGLIILIAYIYKVKS